MIYFILFVTIVWTLIAISAAGNFLATPRLARAEEPAAPAEANVSVIIAARDEQERIEQCVRRLLAQSGVNLQLIVVDDRSTDQTPAILKRLQSEFPQLDVARVDSLPAGWLGKCHACWLGASRASAPWLLFTDADVHMAPDLVQRAVAAAEREQADHLTLWPGVNCNGVVAQGVMLAFAQCMAMYSPPRKINRDVGKRGFGVGAFNLIRRETYDTLGGHQTLAMEVVDDAKLGMLVRKRGFRQRIYDGSQELDCNWAMSVPGIIRAVDKNWFAAMHYNTSASVFAVAMMFVLWFGAVLAPLLDPLWGWLGPAALALTILPGIVQAKTTGWSPLAGLFVPLGYLCMAIAAINSVWKTLRQGGVRWRDTFYPLAELRAGVVR